MSEVEPLTRCSGFAELGDAIADQADLTKPVDWSAWLDRQADD